MGQWTILLPLDILTPNVLPSSSGLGRATVDMLLEEGAFVSIVDLNQPEADWKQPDHVRFFQTDIRNVEDIQKAVTGTVNWVSTMQAPLGGVINCAGVGTAAKVCMQVLTFNIANFE